MIVSHHRLRVRVTRTDIRRSLRGYPKWGPLSWGIFRLDASIRGTVYAAVVTIHETEFRTGLVLNYTLSRRARKFLRDFEARKTIEPFTTILRLVPAARRATSSRPSDEWSEISTT